MASYVISFSTDSSNLNDWKVIPLDDTDSTYASPALGHVGIDISGSEMNNGNAVTIGVAWADCDANKGNAILGVTKYIEFYGETTSRRTGLNNLSGDYVLENIRDSISSLPPPLQSIGIGPAIDLRSSSTSRNIKRILLVGFVTADLFPARLTLIITPTKII